MPQEHHVSLLTVVISPLCGHHVLLMCRQEYVGAVTPAVTLGKEHAEAALQLNVGISNAGGSGALLLKAWEVFAPRSQYEP